MKKLSIIHIIGILGLLLIAAPILYLITQAFEPTESVLKSHLLFRYSTNTLIMVLLVGVMTSLLGVTLSYIVTFYSLPLKKFFAVALALPLAFPPYIAAYAYADFTYSGGLLHRFLTMIGIPKYFDIMNFWGAIFIYTITLYPYVYLMCLSFYRNSSASLIDNGRVLGAGPVKLFLRVGLPMARLPMVAGVTLAIMELISDFGVVDYFGVQAFSTGIYKTWQNYGDFEGAVRLSVILLLIILAIVLLESATRRRLRYFTSTKSNLARPVSLSAGAAGGVYAFFSLVILLCLMIPIVQLLYNSSFVWRSVLNRELFSVLFSTIYYSGLSALICVVIAFIIANFTVGHQGRLASFVSRLATMGYSVPGVIIGLAVIFSFIDLDKALVPLYRWIGITDKVLVLSTGVFILIFAYVVRFLAVGYNNIYSGYKKINPNLFRASHTLGKSGLTTFLRVDLPLMFPTLLTSFLLVFLEVIKELPITLMLKPYNVETLTGKVHMYAHNEQYAEASVFSLIIVCIGLISLVITMSRRVKN